MRRLAAVLFVGALAPARAQDAVALPMATSVVQLEGRKIGEFVAVDVDGDGRDDLVLATHDDDGRTRRLEVRLRRQGTPAFPAVADVEQELVRDVVGFAIADVHPRPGRELVLFSPSLAVAVWREAESGAQKLARIAPIELLWQPPHLPHTHWLDRAVVDVDGDGLDDLLVPEANAYRVLVQRRAADGTVSFASSVLAVPPPRADLRDASAARLRAQGDSIRLRLREKDRTRLDFVLEVDESVPVPACADWDGDGDLDVIAAVDRMLCVWRYDAGYPREPSLTAALPDTSGSVINPSNSVQVHDLDGDRRLDVVAVGSKVEDDEARSYVDVLLQQQDGSLAAKSTDRLMLKGFAAVPRFEDVDGDGRADLVVGALRTDLIGQLGSNGGGRVDAQLNVFLNRFEAGAGRFARPVALAEVMQLPGDVLRGRVRRRVVASFVQDLDGDGLRELVQRTEATKLAVRRTRRDGDQLALGDTLWSASIDERATVVPVASAGGLALWVVEERQISHFETEGRAR